MNRGEVWWAHLPQPIASGNLKVTPDLLVQGGDSVGGLLAAFLTSYISGATKASAASTTNEPAKQG